MTRTNSTRFRSWRIAQDFSLRDVAGLTGLSDSYVSLLERGLRNPSPRTKVAVARRLGVDVADIFEVDPIEGADAVAVAG